MVINLAMIDKSLHALFSRGNAKFYRLKIWRLIMSLNMNRVASANFDTKHQWFNKHSSFSIIARLRLRHVDLLLTPRPYLNPTNETLESTADSSSMTAES
jgi:hypothetical protein